MKSKTLKSFFFLFLVSLIALTIPSCSDKDPDPEVCTTDNITYDNYAKDFISKTCATANCHANDVDANGGMMTTYEEVKTYFQLGRVKGAINHLDGFNNMPKGMEKLDDCDIDKLEAWIDGGYPE